MFGSLWQFQMSVAASLPAAIISGFLSCVFYDVISVCVNSKIWFQVVEMKLDAEFWVRGLCWKFSGCEMIGLVSFN